MFFPLDSEMYRSILESLPIGLCIVDLEKKIVLWSDGAERITGHLRYEVIGHSCIGEPLLHCDQPGCEFCNEECPLARAIKQSQPCEAMGFLHHKGGYEISAQVRAVPVRDRHGLIVGAVEIFESQEEKIASASGDQRVQPPGSVDEVSGVANRVMMESHLRDALRTLAEVHLPFAILFFRLEGLQEFRARFGNSASTSLLRVVAHSLESALWRSDFVGRWCDDQFVVILNSCREQDVAAVRERIRRIVANNGIEWWGERRWLPVSIGQGTPQQGDSVELLVARAQQSVDAISAWRARSAAASSGDPSPSRNDPAPHQSFSGQSSGQPKSSGEPES